MTGLKKVDEDIFTGMMKMYRNWSDARCLEFWNEYKSDPDVKRDEQGPRHSKLRLHLPYSFFGEDRQEDKNGIYEDRSLQRSNKASKMSEDEVHGFRSEVARGFKRLSRTQKLWQRCMAPSVPAASRLKMAKALQ